MACLLVVSFSHVFCMCLILSVDSHSPRTASLEFSRALSTPLFDPGSVLSVQTRAKKALACLLARATI